MGYSIDTTKYLHTYEALGFENQYSVKDQELTVCFEQPVMARLFEIK